MISSKSAVSVNSFLNLDEDPDNIPFVFLWINRKFLPSNSVSLFSLSFRQSFLFLADYYYMLVINFDLHSWDYMFWNCFCSAEYLYVDRYWKENWSYQNGEQKRMIEMKFIRNQYNRLYLRRMIDKMQRILQNKLIPELQIPIFRLML